MDYSLRPACLGDLPSILTWVGTAERLRLWGGPQLSFPPNPEAIWSAIEASPENSFALIDSSGQLAGFAQALPRGSSVHLARIIVSPSLRGHGVGRILCQKLIHLASSHYHPTEITLRVYTSNTPALSLYQSLGFVPTAEAQEPDSLRMCFRPNP